MKKIFTIIAAVLLTATVIAQTPDKMSYQAVIRDVSDNLVTNQTVGIQISILQGSTNGTVVYSETQTPTTNENGLLSVEIGGEVGFDTISWGNGLYFIKTEIDPNGGSIFTITGTSQLLSVPYALFAKTAENVFSGNYNDLTNQPSIPLNVSELTNDVGYISSFTEVDGDISNEIQDLSQVLAEGNDANANNITNLLNPINGQDAATKAYVDSIYELIQLEIIASKGVEDFDGNKYEVIVIGNQIWMAENLKTTHYSDGTPISLITGNSNWAALNDDNIDKAYCFYNDNANNEADTYGALYSYAAATNGDTSGVDVQGVCPAGWHLPNNDEWTTLTDELGGLSLSGGKLKEIGTTHWLTPNTGAVNSSGFTALPAGSRHRSTGVSEQIEQFGFWWSSTDDVGTNAWGRYVKYDTEAASSYFGNKSNGISVRCVKN